MSVNKDGQQHGFREETQVSGHQISQMSDE